MCRRYSMPYQELKRFKYMEHEPSRNGTPTIKFVLWSLRVITTRTDEKQYAIILSFRAKRQVLGYNATN